MKKLRYYLRLIAAFIGRFKGVIFVGIIIGILFSLIFRFALPYIKFNRTERIGISGRYQSDTLPDFILSQVGDGLTMLDDSEIPQPKLSSSWETPDKGKTWIFNIKEGVWQDNEKLTSQSLVYEFGDVELERPDEKTIVFKLKDPFSPFPAVVSRPTFKRGLIGTGEWRVEKISVTGTYIQQLELINNNGNKKIYKFYPTVERTKLAFKLGEVDTLLDMFDPAPFNSWQTAKVEKYSSFSQVVTLFYNFNSGYFQGNEGKTLRQALAYGIDKRFLAEDKAFSPISPRSWAYNPQVKSYEYDPERAKKVIEDLPEDMKNNLDVKLVSSPVLLDVAERIKQDWERIGVKTTVQVSSVIPAEFDAFLTILDIPKDPDQYSLWHSTQKSTNISGYSNQRIDKLLEDGRSTLDIEERRKIYLDFQRFLMEDLPANFLYHPIYYKINRS